MAFPYRPNKFIPTPNFDSRQKNKNNFFWNISLLSESTKIRGIVIKEFFIYL